jgi:hypothetical protein
MILIIYLAIGVYSFFWIKRDAEFRAGSWAVAAIPAIFAWPVMNLIWLLIRGKEKLTSIAAKQSHRDYQIYMRSKKNKDLFAFFPETGPAQKSKYVESTGVTSNAAQANNPERGIFQDHNLENLIAEGKWDEAMAVAQEMRKVAIQTEDEGMVRCYDVYIQRIEDGHRMELD